MSGRVTLPVSNLGGLAWHRSSVDLSDATITCGSHVFKVSKVVFCAKSEFSRVALTVSFLTSNVNLPEDDPSVIVRVLFFLYTEQFPAVLHSDDSQSYHTAFQGIQDTTTSSDFDDDEQHLQNCIRPALVFAVAVKYKIDSLRRLAAVKLGNVITLDVRSAGYLVAALSTFVGLVGTAAWSVLAFFIHQHRSLRGKQDGLYFQHQVLFRNPSSPVGALWDIGKIYHAWRKFTDPNRAPKLKTRSIILTLPPLLIFFGFATAGIFVSEIAGKSYESNDVLLEPGRCGSFVFDDTPNGTRALIQKIPNDTIAGRAYVDNCYQPSGNIAQCSLYPTPSIHYSSSQVECPFGSDASAKNLCKSNQNYATQLDTGLLNTNDIFGINAAPQNQVLVRKRLTCSPIDTSSYVTVSNCTDPIQLLNPGPIYGVSDFTYRYHSNTKSYGVSYQVFSVPAEYDAWYPIAPLQIATGDVSAVVLSANSVRYAAPVKDAWFRATTPIQPGGGLPTEYTTDVDIAVMGCIDQAQICNPDKKPPSCTSISKLEDVVLDYEQIGLNDYQAATTKRILYYFASATAFYSLDGLDDNALLARRNILEGISSGLPDNQWQIEMTGWFETSLAKIQAYVLESITNTAYTGQPGQLVAPINDVAASFCNQQRVRNIGGYQNFSLLGLCITVCIGIVIIILSWMTEPVNDYFLRCLSRSGVPDQFQIARIANYKLQLQRSALMGAGYADDWEGNTFLQEIPVPKTGRLFALPARDGEDYSYAVRQEPSLEPVNSGDDDKAPDRDTSDKTVIANTVEIANEEKNGNGGQTLGNKAMSVDAAELTDKGGNDDQADG